MPQCSTSNDSLNNWDPMKESYYDQSHNSYIRGPGSKIPAHLQPAAYRKGANLFTLYVGNLNPKHSMNALRNIFSLYGNVRHVKICNQKHNKPYGFVSYSTQDEANTALTSLDGHPDHGFKIEYALSSTPLSQPLSSDSKQTDNINSDYANKPADSFLGDQTDKVYLAKPNILISIPVCGNLNCAKRTFQNCPKCGVPFCSEECLVFGYKIHKKNCVQYPCLSGTENSSISSISMKSAFSPSNGVPACQSPVSESILKSYESFYSPTLDDQMPNTNCECDGITNNYHQISRMSDSEQFQPIPWNSIRFEPISSECDIGYSRCNGSIQGDEYNKKQLRSIANLHDYQHHEKYSINSRGTLLHLKEKSMLQANQQENQLISGCDSYRRNEHSNVVNREIPFGVADKRILGAYNKRSHINLKPESQGPGHHLAGGDYFYNQPREFDTSDEVSSASQSNYQTREAQASLIDNMWSENKQKSSFFMTEMNNSNEYSEHNVHAGQDELNICSPNLNSGKGRAQGYNQNEIQFQKNITLSGNNTEQQEYRKGNRVPFHERQQSVQSSDNGNYSHHTNVESKYDNYNSSEQSTKKGKTVTFVVPQKENSDCKSQCNREKFHLNKNQNYSKNQKYDRNSRKQEKNYQKCNQNSRPQRCDPNSKNSNDPAVQYNSHFSRIKIKDGVNAKVLIRDLVTSIDNVISIIFVDDEASFRKFNEDLQSESDLQEAIGLQAKMKYLVNVDGLIKRVLLLKPDQLGVIDIDYSCKMYYLTTHCLKELPEKYKLVNPFVHRVKFADAVKTHLEKFSSENKSFNIVFEGKDGAVWKAKLAEPIRQVKQKDDGNEAEKCTNSNSNYFNDCEGNINYPVSLKSCEENINHPVLLKSCEENINYPVSLKTCEENINYPVSLKSCEESINYPVSLKSCEELEPSTNVYDDASKICQNDICLPIHSKSSKYEDMFSLSLSAGTIFKLFVTHIINDKEFYVADDNELDRITTIALESLDDANLDPTTVSIGTRCLAEYESFWCRVRIISMDPVTAFFIDFGNSSPVDVSLLKSAPQELMAVAPLAKKVKLSHGTVSSVNVKSECMFEMFIISQDVDQSWIVTDCKNRNVVLCHQLSDTEFYVIPQDFLVIQSTEIQNNLNSLLQSPLKVGLICSKNYEGINYRVCVKSVTPLRVKYLDYGSEEDAKLEELMELPIKLQELEPAAYVMNFNTNSKLQSDTKVTVKMLVPKNVWEVIDA